MNSKNTRNELRSHEPMFGKREKILLAVIILAVASFGLIGHILHSDPANRVEVAVLDEHSNRTILETFDLTNNTSYTIVTAPAIGSDTDGLNQLIIEDREVWISEANCPNQDCVKKGKISLNGEMLVCLPHRVTVSIVGE